MPVEQKNRKESHLTETYKIDRTRKDITQVMGLLYIVPPLTCTH